MAFSDNKRNIQYKKLTLLHSNDLHGDFLAETVDEKLVGGVSRLSGYINDVRKNNPNTLYMVAGDMFRGSLIDSEFQGISTIEIMNVLAPDVVSLGNHEVDYGIAHLLFLEKCCRFPIVNSNVYIKTLGSRLFNSHTVLSVDGMKILVIGILTEEIMQRAKQDNLLGTFINVEDATREVGIICDSYQNTDIDLTILLTHIGYENDCKLAAELDPSWGVDIIIGGHSHTLLDKATVINNTVIVQAGIGTDQIGRFDIEVDTVQNRLSSFDWTTVPVNEANCPRNPAIEELIYNYKKITDEKYGAVLSTLTAKATHPSRYMETEVGNLFADIMSDNFELDLALIGSGSLRKEEIGPVISRGDLLDMYSFDEKYIKICLTGEQLILGMENMLRQAVDSRNNDHSEYYQISRGFRFVFDSNSDSLVTALYKGEPIKPGALFTVGIEGFHANNMDKFLGLSEDEVRANGNFRLISGNIRHAIEEYLMGHAHITPVIEGRTEIIM